MLASLAAYSLLWRFHVVGVSKYTSSHSFKTSTVGFDTGKYENTPLRDSEILKFVSAKNIECPSTSGLFRCILGISFTFIFSHDEGWYKIVYHINVHHL